MWRKYRLIADAINPHDDNMIRKPKYIVARRSSKFAIGAQAPRG
jgi:hypothetical protein